MVASRSPTARVGGGHVHPYRICDGDDNGFPDGGPAFQRTARLAGTRRDSVRPVHICARSHTAEEKNGKNEIIAPVVGTHNIRIDFFQCTVRIGPDRNPAGMTKELEYNVECLMFNF